MAWMPPEIETTNGRISALKSVRLPVSAAPRGLPTAGDGLAAADILIRDGRIAGIAPPEHPLPGAIVWPCPVDCHTHIDKGEVWPRAANPDGSFAGALAASLADATIKRDPGDLRRRAAFMLGAAHAHGTVALRSHVDGGVDWFDHRWGNLCDLAEDWRGRVDVQLAPFTGPEEPWPWVETLAVRATHRCSGVLSAFLYHTDGLERFLDGLISLAGKNGLALDFHADESLDPQSRCTELVAEAVLRNRFEGPVLVGHACALSAYPAERLDQALDVIAKSGIGIVSLPVCNSYLMARAPGTTPRQRGFAPVHELRARGVRVALASDNARDAFYAYGDLDMPELFRDAVRMMQLDHPVGDWPGAVLGRAADLIGRPDLGRIAVGGRADLIVFRARNWSEFMARPASDRVLIRDGVAIETTPPDFALLDDLEGMTP